MGMTQLSSFVCHHHHLHSQGSKDFWNFLKSAIKKKRETITILTMTGQEEQNKFLTFLNGLSVCTQECHVFKVILEMRGMKKEEEWYLLTTVEFCTDILAVLIPICEKNGPLFLCRKFQKPTFGQLHEEAETPTQLAVLGFWQIQCRAFGNTSI